MRLPGCKMQVTQKPAHPLAPPQSVGISSYQGHGDQLKLPRKHLGAMQCHQHEAASLTPEFSTWEGPKGTMLSPHPKTRFTQHLTQHWENVTKVHIKAWGHPLCRPGGKEGCSLLAYPRISGWDLKAAQPPAAPGKVWQPPTTAWVRPERDLAHFLWRPRVVTSFIALPW